MTVVGEGMLQQVFLRCQDDVGVAVWSCVITGIEKRDYSRWAENIDVQVYCAIVESSDE